MRGKVARQLRQAIEYKPKYIGLPQLLVKRVDKGHTLILDPNGTYQSGDIRYSIKETEREITQLHTEPLRQMYKDFKKQWYQLTRADMRKAPRNEQEDK